jgi:hypothetical protein
MPPPGSCDHSCTGSPGWTPEASVVQDSLPSSRAASSIVLENLPEPLCLSGHMVQAGLLKPHALRKPVTCPGPGQ